MKYKFHRFFILFSCLVIPLSESLKDANLNLLYCHACMNHCKLAWSSTSSFKFCSKWFHHCTNSSYSMAQFFRNHRCTTVQIPIISAQNGNLYQRIGSSIPSVSDFSNIPNSLGQNCPRFHEALGLLSSKCSREIVDRERRCRRDLEFERKRLRNCTGIIRQLVFTHNEDTIMMQYKGRLINDTDLLPIVEEEPSSNETTEYRRLGALRSWAGIRTTHTSQHSGPTQEVCATRSRVISPEQVKHISDRTVAIWAPGRKKQYFFIRECKYPIPSISITTKTGGPRCEMVENFHKALIKVQRGDINMIKHPGRTCKKISGKTYFICDEWVKLRSHCALFIS